MEIENLAVSYQKLSDRYITWNEELYAYDPAVCGFGYGQIVSTVRDLYKFSRSFSSDRLLSKEYLDMYLKMRNIKSHPPVPGISKALALDFFGTCGNGFAGEISILQDPDTQEKEMLYWHDGTDMLFKSNHFHYAGKEQIIIICSNCSFLNEGNEIVLKIHQLLNNKPYEQIRIKHSLSQYISEDIAMHAGIPAAIEEYFRFKDDTARFIVPDQDYIMYHGRIMAELGDLDNAILLFQAAVTAFPDSWKAYDALGDVYRSKGDTEQAVQNFKKSLELNPGNRNAQKMLKKLE
jgi:tetratricopeptide (TPR) repeat protein